MDFEPSDVISAVFISNSGQSRRFGMATLRVESKRLTVCDMADNEQFTVLEAVMVQARPKSVCVFSSDPQDRNRVTQLLSDLAEDVIIKDKSDFKDSSLTDDLEKVITDAKGGEQRYRAAIVLLERHPLARGPLACLIRHYNLLGVESFARSLTVTTHQVTSALQLDRAALLALNVFPPRKAGESLAIASSSTQALGSLYGVLNRTRTGMGARKLAFWLAQPLLDVAEIRRRHDVVEALTNASEARQVLQADYLRRMPDLSKLAVKLRALASAAQAIKEAPEKEQGRLKGKAIKMFSLEDLVKLYDGLCVAHALDRALDTDLAGPSSELSREHLNTSQKRASWDTLVSEPIKEATAATYKLLLLVEKTVDLKEAESGRFVINRGMDAAFAQVAGVRDSIKEKMDAERRRIGAEVARKSSNKKAEGESMVKMVKDNTHGYLFRVPRKEHPTTSKMPTVQSITLNKAEFLFTTTKLTGLVREIRDCEREYDALQAALAYKACTVAATYNAVVERLAGHIATLDVLAAFGLVAATAPTPYCRPVMEGGLEEVSVDQPMTEPVKGEADPSVKTEEGAPVMASMMAGPPVGLRAEEETDVEVTRQLKWTSGDDLELVQCRHPIAESVSVAHSALTGSNGEFFANDFSVSKSAGKPRVQVITGPNMGGKSTYLRQVALCCLMAQVGSLVPAQSAKLPVLRQILCRVGASDLQLRGISTFFHEMGEASAILAAAGADSLVIIDELGRGTSTSDGFGLAWAIARDLAERAGCFGVFATHFHEMAGLADVVEGGRVGNLHVTAAVNPDSKSINFLYQVRPGGTNASYGVDVAAIAGLPAKTVENARHQVRQLERVEELVRSSSSADLQDVQENDEEEPAAKRSKQSSIVTDIFSVLEKVLAQADPTAVMALAKGDMRGELERLNNLVNGQ